MLLQVRFSHFFQIIWRKTVSYAM
jgi:hypothetical protein